MKRSQAGKAERVTLRLSPEETEVLRRLSLRLQAQGVKVRPRKVLLALLEAAMVAEEGGVLDLEKALKATKGGR